ncbi:hypothetical protein [Conexibacter sp. SYSU D00693]|uniref:hypothetical protein n=1 Tax=Conexibacter sp. SYSU D00693 TaxID=2812560 RepID=UPI00196AD431|nr:hypothetical protein [Conexibacter sp. SYSU D00693]
MSSQPETDRRPGGGPRRPAGHPVEVLDGACRFSDDPQLTDPIWVIRELRRHRAFSQPLIDATTVSVWGKQQRAAGSWALLYLGYVLSGQTSMRRFHDLHASSPLWRECGFDEAPSYWTMRNRFEELEADGMVEAFEDCAGALIRHAKTREPGVGRYVDVDGTAFQVNSQLVHACPDRRACLARSRAAKFLRGGGGDEVNAHRHALQAKPADEMSDGDRLPADVVGRLDGQQVADLGLDDRYAWFRLGDHLYRSRDTSAGCRMLGGGTRRRKRFWHGGTALAATDRLTGGRLAHQIIAADVNEHAAYPELIEGVQRATGHWPAAVGGDRALSLDPVYLWNTQQAIGSAFPFRKRSAGDKREDHDGEITDRHGVPRCKHCGGPGDVASPGLGFYRDGRGVPRVRFRCMLVHVDRCRAVQSRKCSDAPRDLQPLPRLTDTYMALREGGLAAERTHHHARDRYALAGNDPHFRPRRTGLPAVRLRAAASLVLEWLRICLRQGWLTSTARRNTNSKRRVSGAHRLARVLDARIRHRVDRPYGPAAVRLGLVDDDPPPDAPPDGDEIPF